MTTAKDDTIKLLTAEVETLRKELDWFRDFGWKVDQISSSVNNKACEYADDRQKEKLE
jgi:hypothetical protein|tara:strand:+ start:2290 stop:2463 length:174 start_codon:yes stop_codon:yes gene_type:complete